MNALAVLERMQDDAMTAHAAMDISDSERDKRDDANAAAIDAVRELVAAARAALPKSKSLVLRYALAAFPEPPK